MDSLPVLVPVVAAALCIPGVFFCGCYRALSVRLTALEGRIRLAEASAAIPLSPQPSSGYVGGVTYGVASAPPPSAPAYPVYLTPPQLPPQRPLQRPLQPYWSQQPPPQRV